MPRFRFEAVDVGGRKQRGVLSASGAAAIEADLEGRGLLPVRIEELSAAQTLPRLGARQEVLEASRSISALLNAGLPLSRCMALTENNVGDRVRTALREIRGAVERGQPLAAALDAHPRLFPPLYRGLVRAGERSGDLRGAFTRLVAHLEREEETRGRILSASIYPMVLLTFGGTSLLVILLFVVPRFAELVTDAGAALPESAAFLLGISGLLRDYWFVFAIGGAGLCVFFAWLVLTPNGRRAASRFALGLPLGGGVRREVLAGRFSRMFGTLLASGAPALTALRDVAESVVDPALRDAIERVGVRVREGERVAAALRANRLFPDLLVRLVGIGEDSGNLPDFALKAAEILEQRSERRVRRWISLIEPMVIVVFGGLIALVAVSLLQAIYGVNAGAFR